MMHTLIVRNYLGEELKIDLRNPYDHGLAVTKITGVGESSAEVNIGDYASSDGGYFNSSRALSRIITIHISFLEAPTIDAARHTSYKFFPAKRKVTLEFLTDERHSMIEGYVEKNLATVFERSTGAVITIVCPDSALKAAITSTESFYGEKPIFSFPFSNDHNTNKLISFGTVQVQAEEIVFYSGEREAGMLIWLKASGRVQHIKLHNTINREMLSINTDVIEAIMGSPFGIGDELVISTVPGEKYARLLRDGEYTNVLNSISRDSDWLTLSRGDNIFSYTAEEGTDDLRFSMEFRPLYEGI